MDIIYKRVIWGVDVVKRTICTILYLVLCMVVIMSLIGCSNGIDRVTDEELESYISKLQQSDNVSEIAIKESQTETQLEIQGTPQYTIEGDYIHINGSVKNTGDTPITYFKIVCKFMDEEGQVLDSAYTNSILTVEPNEMQKFEIIHKFDSRFRGNKLIIEEVN